MAAKNNTVQRRFRSRTFLIPRSAKRFIGELLDTYRQQQRYRRDYQNRLHLSYFRRFGCNHILDVPCGRAHFLKLDPTAIVGLDMNWETLREIGIGGAKLVRGSALGMPFRDEAFEGVHCANLIEHFLPDEAYSLLRELGRVTAKEGILIIRTPVMWKHFYDDFTHVKPYNPSALLRYCCQIGGQRSRERLPFKFELVDLIWHYFPLIYRKKALGNRKGPIVLLFDYLYQFGIRSWKRHGYTLVMRKVL